MKFRITLVSAALLGTAMLVGCGGSGGSSSSPDDQGSGNSLDVTIQGNCESRSEYIWVDGECRIEGNPYVRNLNAIERLPSQDRENLIAYLVSTEKFQSFASILPGFAESTNSDEPNNDTWIDNHLLAEKLNKKLVVEVGAQQVLIDQLTTASTGQTWVQRQMTETEINGELTSKSAEFFLSDGELSISVMGEEIYKFTPVESFSISAHLGMPSSPEFTEHSSQNTPLYLESSQDQAVFRQPNLEAPIRETFMPTDASKTLVKDALSLSEEFTDAHIHITQGTTPTGFKLMFDNTEGYMQGLRFSNGATDDNIDSYLAVPKTVFENSIDSDKNGTIDFQIWFKPTQYEDLGLTANTILSANGSLGYSAQVQELDSSEFAISFVRIIATSRAVLNTAYNLDESEVLSAITNDFVSDYHEKSEALRNSGYFSELEQEYQDGFPQAFDILPVYTRLVGGESFAAGVMDNEDVFSYFLTRAKPNYSEITAANTVTPYRHYDFVVGRFITNSLAYELSNESPDISKVLDRWTLVSNNLDNFSADFYNSILDPIELILDELPEASVASYQEAISQLAATFGYRHISITNSSLLGTITEATVAGVTPYEEPVVETLESLRLNISWNQVGRFWSVDDDEEETLEQVPLLLTTELKNIYQTHDDVAVLFDIPLFAYNFIFLEPETAQSKVEAKTVVLNHAVENTRGSTNNISNLQNHNLGRWKLISRAYSEDWNEHVYADVIEVLRYLPRNTFTGDLQCNSDSLASRYNCVRLSHSTALERLSVNDTGYLANDDRENPFVTKAAILEGWIAKQAELSSLNSLDSFHWENSQITSFEQGDWLSCSTAEVNRRIDRGDDLMDAALAILRVDANPLPFSEERDRYNALLDEYKDLMEACR